MITGSASTRFIELLPTAFTKFEEVIFLRVVRRRSDDVVTVAAMRAPSNDDACFRAVGSPDAVTIAGNRLDIPDDRRHVQLLGCLVSICSTPTCVMRWYLSWCVGCFDVSNLQPLRCG